MAPPAPKGWAATSSHSAEPEPERGRTLQRGRAARQELHVYWHNRGSDHVHDDDDGDSEVFVGMNEIFRCDAADYLRSLADFLGDTRGSCRLHLLTCTEGSVDVVVDTRLDLPTVISIMRRCRVCLPSDFYTSGSAAPRSEYTNFD